MGPCAIEVESLRVEQGEMVALLGASGSGKSTLLRHLNGLHGADAGSDQRLDRRIRRGRPGAAAAAQRRARAAALRVLGGLRRPLQSCAPDPTHHEKLAFEPRIVLQLRRDKSGGGCG